MRDIHDGAIVALECLGSIQVPEHRFLDAITDSGDVKLSPSFEPPFTGARWYCWQIGGEFALISAGAVHGFRYLDGVTQAGAGFAQAVGDMLPPFSGTRWRIQEISPGIVTLENQGEVHNPQFRFLDGRTQEGKVGLAPSTDHPFTGTKWRTIALPAPTIDVGSAQRNQLGSDILVKGQNFTAGDAVRFSFEGIQGHGGPRHRPQAFGSANVQPDGTFERWLQVRYIRELPVDFPEVVVRATDHNGRTAQGITSGFYA